MECIFCSNKISLEMYTQGYNICNECYSKYNKKITKFVSIQWQPKQKAILLDDEGNFTNSVNPYFGDDIKECLTYRKIYEYDGILFENLIFNNKPKTYSYSESFEIYEKLMPMLDTRFFTGVINNYNPEKIKEKEETIIVELKKRRISFED